MPRKSEYSGECSAFSVKLFDDAVKKLYAEHSSAVFKLGNSCLVTCAALLAHMDTSGKCYPGRATIAKLTSLSPNTVTSCIKKLEESGLVRVQRTREGRVTRNYYTFVDVSWAKTMTWTSGDAYEMNTEPDNKPSNWVEFAFDWMARNSEEGQSPFAKQIRTACDQRGVDEPGTMALLNFSALFPEVPFIRGMWMGVGNANVKTLVLLGAHDMNIMREAVQMRRNMLSAMQEEITPPAHPLQLQTFLAQAVAKANAAAARAKQAAANEATIESAGYAASSDLDF